MHLNPILVSSFLFTSVSLAGFIRPQGAILQPLDNTSSPKVIFTNYAAGATFGLENGTFSYVTGTITVPRISGPANRNFSIVMGMDDLMCEGGHFLAGVDATMTTHGPEYKAWYSNPAVFNHFNISVSAGDRISFIVKATNNRSGAVFVLNGNTDQYDQWFGDFGQPLCQREVNWLIAVSPSHPFTDFDVVQYTYAEAIGRDGQAYQPQNVNYVYDLMDFKNRTALTSVTTDENSVIIKPL